MSFFLPKNYVDRLKPAYFPDEDDGVSWQIGVYELVRDLFQGVTTFAKYSKIIDIGCGRARKLKNIVLEMPNTVAYRAVGYDCAETVKWLKTNEPWIDAHEIDLERCADLVLDPTALIVCADVVEHLIDPTQLMELLAYTVEYGGTVILSTPDRILCRGVDDKGPPFNKAHVREWTMAEFVLFCKSFGLKNGEYSYTQTSDAGPEKHTITAVFR